MIYNRYPTLPKYICRCPAGTVCNCAAIQRFTANEQARLAVQKGITREYLRILNHLKR